jgi:quinol monooxygenase YgiN
MSSDVTVVIYYRAQAGKEEAAVRELAALIETVVAREPACRGIEMLQDTADPARILLYERWVDKASYVGPHLQTPHILAFLQQRAGELFVGPPDITFWGTVAHA